VQLKKAKNIFGKGRKKAGTEYTVIVNNCLSACRPTRRPLSSFGVCKIAVFRFILSSAMIYTLLLDEH
jgi:hypothetical protein